MTVATDSHDVRRRINQRWSAYARQASLTRNRTSRKLDKLLPAGALAAVAPLVAAGGALGQVQCNPFVGTFSILLDGVSRGSTVAMLLTSPSFDVAFSLQVSAGTGILTAFVDGPGFGNTGIAASFGRGLVIPFTQSENVPLVASGGTWGQNVELCRRYTGTGGTDGTVCPPDGTSYLGLRYGDTVGWMELEIFTFLDSEVSFAISDFAFNSVPNVPIHVDDCETSSLPVELVSFQAVTGDRAIDLSWDTASEINNAGFEVQRASSSSGFSKIGFVNGAATTTEPSLYSFRDDSAEPNIQYKYRLKQIDFDGTSSFSDVVEAFIEDHNQVAVTAVHPNPVGSSSARFEVNVAEASESTVEVFDIRGALVLRQDRMLNRGQNRIHLESSGLAPGPHFVKVQVGEQVLYRPFIVAGRR